MSATISEPIAEALYAAVEVVEQLKLPYAVVGGLAVQAHARPRWTQDVDLVLDPGSTQPSEISRLMKKRGFKAASAKPVSLAGVVLLQFDWPGRRLPIDIRVDLLLGIGDFQRQLAARAESLPMGARHIRVVKPEDLLLLKLVAQRPVDFVDAVDLIRENPTSLDEAYLGKWARHLGITRRLRDAFREARRART